MSLATLGLIILAGLVVLGVIALWLHKPDPLKPTEHRFFDHH